MVETDSRTRARGAPSRSDGYLAIEDYAAIGDGRTLALVGRDGAIDWMCLPELDAPSVFGALLDPERGGYFALSPAVPYGVARRYLERTNVLETTFETDRGTVRVLDALTIDRSQTTPWRELVRRVESLDGAVPMRWELRPRFGFGQRTADFGRSGSSVVTRDHGLQLALRAWDAGEARIADGAVQGQFELGDGRAATLVLVATDEQPLMISERAASERRLAETVAVWRSWVGRHCYDGPWRDAVERSLLAIKLLADGRTGAIAAAATTSLPEVIGGERNYDYRFGWVRDLCFALDALLAVGMDELTHTSLGWLLEVTRHTQPRIDPVYALGGDVVRGQERMPLAGYRRTTPVHIGNGAGGQLQLGGFGDFIETIASYVGHGHLVPPSTGDRLADTADLLVRIWRNEDSGLWELGDSAHYGTSKLGCWVAFDRLLDLVDRGQVPARHLDRWRRERELVREFLEHRLFSEQKRSYLLEAGSERLDCGMLLAARRRFARRERLEGTIAAIRNELHAEGPLFYRYSGMQDKENAFLACSFWMVEALALAGRHDEAAELMGAAVGVSNDVGLHSEQIEPGTHALRGNFPQALSHLALISAAAILAREAS